MSYMLLIVEPRGQRNERSEPEGRAAYDRMVDFSADLKARGLLRLSQSLRTDEIGVRVRRRAGNASVMDGPFAESKEMVGGVILVDCATRQEAIAIASECPAAEWATVEVRELGPCFT
jgi:hypothetical protein